MFTFVGHNKRYFAFLGEVDGSYQRRSDLTAMVLKQAFLLAGSGLGIGIAMSLLTRQILANEIFGIRFLDLPVYVGMILLLATTALAAAALPARRAASIDPMQTLRME